jgi:hypothetical protein
VQLREVEEQNRVQGAGAHMLTRFAQWKTRAESVVADKKCREDQADFDRTGETAVCKHGFACHECR